MRGLRSGMVVAMLSLLAVATVDAQQFQQVRITASQGSLRQGPDTNTAVLGSVANGTMLEVIGRSGAWYQVRLAPDLGIPAQVGFVHESLVQPVALQQTAPQQVYAPAQQQPTYVPPQQPAAQGYPGYGQPYPGARPDGYKDPTMSRVFSIVVPGGGQFYSGETMKGATILGLWASGWILPGLFAYNSVDDCYDEYYTGDYSDCDADGIVAAAYLGWAVSLGSWIYGIVDAGNAAKRANARLGIVVGDFEFRPAIAASPSGGASLGLSVAF